jgi:hypothetical protein
MANSRRTFKEVRADVAEAASEAKANIWSKLSTWAAACAYGMETIAGTAAKHLPTLGYAELGNQMKTYLDAWIAVRADAVGVIVIMTSAVAMLWTWASSFGRQYKDVRTATKKDA